LDRRLGGLRDVLDAVSFQNVAKFKNFGTTIRTEIIFITEHREN
jgi:hypothetical protein